MPVTVFMNEMGMIVDANPQGDILTEGFFRTEEETDEALEAMGYQRLLTVYPAAEGGVLNVEIRRAVKPTSPCFNVGKMLWLSHHLHF